MADHIPEQIEQWAREAGCTEYLGGPHLSWEQAARFAAIVAAAERAECAKLCDDEAEDQARLAAEHAGDTPGRQRREAALDAAQDIARAIRARGAQGEAER